MIGLLQRRFALSRRGAADLIKGCLACLVLIFFCDPLPVQRHLFGHLCGERCAEDFSGRKA